MPSTAGLASGSSPLARGTLSRVVLVGNRAGLIPARAGNTSLGGKLRLLPWAHPRSRGEHGVAVTQQGKAPGSSPLARGTPAVFPEMNFSVGLIPARAGNTDAVPSPTCGHRAHPRSRGEHGVIPGGQPGGVGSSPLARGTRSVRVVSVFLWGLIPARAGNTLQAHALR